MKSIVGASLLILLFAAVCVRGKRVIRAAEHAEKTGRHIVKLDSETNHEIFQETLENARMLSDDKTVYVENEGVYKFFAMKLPEGSLNQVKKLQNVEYIEEETTVRTALYKTDSWALDRIDQSGGDLDGIYDPGPGRDGGGVDIYILDTGIQYDRSEFGGRAQYPGFDPVDDFRAAVDFMDREGADCHGHGTAVASVAAGNRLGVAKNATLYSVRVIDCFDNSSWSIVINGIDLAVEAAKNSSRPSVISMSLGNPTSTAANEAVEAATNAGVPVVASAGNWGSDACYQSPASAPSAITVGGTAEGDRLYVRTNGGSCVDILAPGEYVLAANFYSENGTLIGSGTSLSAPIVSGVLAISLQERPFLGVQDLTQLLIDTSVKGVIDLSILSDVGLNETTPNRLVQVKNETCRLGDKCKPAQSCQEILGVRPNSKSGDYWLKRANDSIIVYCKMEEVNGRKGLMRLAEIDMSKPNSECPGQLHLRTNPMRMCERASDVAGCSKAMFSTQGIPYTTVCGRINAIQFGGTNAFRPYQLNINKQLTIDDVYVDGVVLSRVNATGNRDHVWTFAAALDETYRPGGRHACPCAHSKNRVTDTDWMVPGFIDEDYFCETGTISEFEYGRFYVEDPLWDGNGCGPTSTCCSRGNYFCKPFHDVMSDDIELRLCGDESRSTEDSPITLVELYIQ